MKNGSVITKIVKNIEKFKTQKSGLHIHILHVTDTPTVDTLKGTGQLYIPYQHLQICLQLTNQHFPVRQRVPGTRQTEFFKDVLNFRFTSVCIQSVK